MSGSCRVSRLFGVLVCSLVFIQQTAAAPQNTAVATQTSTSNATGTGQSGAEAGSLSPNTGLVLGLILGGVFLGIILWFAIMGFRGNKQRKAREQAAQKKGRKPIELDGSTSSGWAADTYGRNTPMRVTFLVDDPEQQTLKDEKTSIQAAELEKPLPTLSRNPSGRARSDITQIMEEHSIRFGESAQSPSSSVFTIPIQGQTESPVVDDSELWYLYRELAIIREQRKHLERLDQLDTLKKREEEIEAALSTAGMSSNSSEVGSKHILSALREARQ